MATDNRKVVFLAYPGGKLVVVLNDYDCEWFRVLQELSKTLGIIPDFSYTLRMISSQTCAAAQPRFQHMNPAHFLTSMSEGLCLCLDLS